MCQKPSSASAPALITNQETAVELTYRPVFDDESENLFFKLEEALSRRTLPSEKGGARMCRAHEFRASYVGQEDSADVFVGFQHLSTGNYVFVFLQQTRVQATQMRAGDLYVPTEKAANLQGLF